MRYTVKVDKQTCIGAGKCVAYAPEAFDFDENDASEPLPSIANVPDEQILQAARLCPVSAITVYDEQGSEIFPNE